MEAHFTLNEDSTNDQVQRALRREVSKLSPVSLPVTTPQSPRKTSKSRKNERSSSANRSKRRDLTRNGNQRKLSAPKKRGETICPSKTERTTGDQGKPYSLRSCYGQKPRKRDSEGLK